MRKKNTHLVREGGEMRGHGGSDKKTNRAFRERKKRKGEFG
jgi:hypothetical protein